MKTETLKTLAGTFLGVLLWANTSTAVSRNVYTLNDKWYSVCYPEGKKDSLVKKEVTLPHNWDDYYGYRQYVHGNLHGTARYVKHFSVYSLTQSSDADALQDRLFMLRLEGAGTYVSVWVNGNKVCEHRPVGRVVANIDITGFLNITNIHASNELEIRCEHPSMQTDMPWVCGGCSSEWGFSEGSAPLGLFRNVSIEVTDKLRIEPFGVHVWANDALDTVFVDTEITNHNRHADAVVLETILNGKLKKVTVQMGAQMTQTIHQEIPVSGWGLKRWSIQDPQTYEVQSVLIRGKRHDIEADRVQTLTGFSNVKWPHRTADGKVNDADHRFYLNGKPVFINGVCEYEHLFGASHALGNEEIDYRCRLVKKLGFNALRDAHQPHNLRYADDLAKEGVMWWPQFSAHIWYDTPQFRENFKTLLRQWVKERRNNPAIILWGVQNESTLPADFARECMDIIKEMDPRCAHVSTDGRLVTTCNGGSGTDWNVVQNWSGTYGGKLSEYGNELAKDDQLLNGEYGGWRTVGLHDHQDLLGAEDFDPKAAWSEEHQCVLLHEKMRLAWMNRDRLCGHFQWVLASHDNPGRQQADEFLRKVDKIGPLNYKGILTATWEPTDAYYLYLAWGLFLKGEWPAGKPEPATLSAREMIKIGYAADAVPLPDYLLDEQAEGECSKPELHSFAEKTSTLRPDASRVYLYRYNCGGDEMTDSWGSHWMADDSHYCYSWSMSETFAQDSLCPVLCSQALVRGWVLDQENAALLAAKEDQMLLRSYRFGRSELKFRFPLPESATPYLVELWFVNARNLVEHVSYKTQQIEDGLLEISFPEVKVGEAKVSAIAISVDKEHAKGLVLPVLPSVKGYPYSEGLTWAVLNTQNVEKTDKSSLPADKNGRVAKKYPVETGSQGETLFRVSTGLAQEYALRFRFKNTTGAAIHGHWQLLPQQDGGVVAEGDITFPETPDKFKMLSTTTGTFVNAGDYRLVISGSDGVIFESVEVQ